MTSPQEGSFRLALLSFPKAGRTWLKLMLKTYLDEVFGLDLNYDQEHDWHKKHEAIPEVVITHEDEPHFKTAEALEPSRAEFANDHVVLAVRDPRDILVSLYFEMTKRKRFYDAWGYDTSHIDENATLSEFVRAPIGSLATLVRYYEIWERARTEVASFELLRYEEIHANPAAALESLLAAGGLPLDREALERAADACSFERMREGEATGSFTSPTLRPADKDDPDSYKVRKGVVGGYLSYFSEEDLDWIDAQCARLPDLFADYRDGVAGRS